MTKSDVKALCEADPQLQWWAMVLFAEISEMVDAYDSNNRPNEADRTSLVNYVRYKAAEFPKLVVQEQLNKAKAKAEEKTS